MVALKPPLPNGPLPSTNRTQEVDFDGIFTSSRLHFSVVSGAVTSIFVVFVSTLAGPQEETSLQQLVSVLRRLGDTIEENGWTIVGLAVALMALAVTAVAIAGLHDADERSSRRRGQIMQLAEIFTLIAVAVLSATLTAATLGFGARLWETRHHGLFHLGTELLILATIAVALLFVLRKSHEILEGIALSDEAITRRSIILIDAEIQHFTNLRESAKNAASHAYGVEAEKLSLPPVKQALWGTLLASTAWILGAALIGAIVAWIPTTSGPSFIEAVLRTGRVMLGIVVLSGLQASLLAFAYTFCFHFLQAGEKAVRTWKFVGSLVLFLPLITIVPFTLTLTFLDPQIDAPLWKRIVLIILIFAPGIATLTLPRAVNWRTYTTVNALDTVEKRLILLEKQRQMNKAIVEISPRRASASAEECAAASPKIAACACSAPSRSTENPPRQNLRKIFPAFLLAILATGIAARFLHSRQTRQ